MPCSRGPADVHARGIFPHIDCSKGSSEVSKMGEGSQLLPGPGDLFSGEGFGWLAVEMNIGMAIRWAWVFSLLFFF